MHRVIKENIAKNILLVLILALSIKPTKDFLFSSPLASDISLAGDIIVVTSIIAVTACFGNFAFTYYHVNLKNFFQKLLVHGTTFIFLLIIGISLIMTSYLTKIIMGRFFLVDICLILLYLACVGHDFWDLQRADNLNFK